MGRVSESVSQNRRSDWDTLSALRLVRILCPGIKAWNGMHFPVESLSGKCDPEFTLEVGCAFPTGPQAETASHSEGRFRDTVSGCKKGHMTWPSTYYMFSRCPHDKPRFNTEASARQRGTYGSSRVPCEQDCPSREPYVPCRRADEPGKTRRYLILVVPGARLGSVSLASVWRCSVYTFLPSRNIS